MALKPGQMIGTPDPGSGMRVVHPKEIMNRHMIRQSFQDAIKRLDKVCVEKFGVVTGITKIRHQHAMNNSYTRMIETNAQFGINMKKIKEELIEKEPK